jgi:hypothetical protein
VGAESKKVFISYRRSESKYAAVAVFQYLTSRGYDVFMDYESLGSGNFEQVILAEIAARPHFILLLAPKSLDRIVERRDWLRREIERAIELERNVIPLFFDGFKFNQVERLLTGNLVKLKDFNGFDIYIDYFFDGMSKLENRFLNSRPVGRISPAPLENQAAVQRTVQNIQQETAGSASPFQEILDRIKAISAQPGVGAGKLATPTKVKMGWIRVQRRKLSFLDRVDEWGLPKLRLMINDRKVAELGSGDEKTIQIEPGSHIVQVGFGFAKSIQTQVQVEAGKTALFECGYDGGNPYLKFVEKYGF